MFRCETMISSPACTFWTPQVLATRLMASVVPRTKTISSVAMPTSAWRTVFARPRTHPWRAPPARARHGDAEFSASGTSSGDASVAAAAALSNHTSGGHAFAQDREVAPNGVDVEWRMPGRRRRLHRRRRRGLDEIEAGQWVPHAMPTMSARRWPAATGEQVAQRVRAGQAETLGIEAVVARRRDVRAGSRAAQILRSAFRQEVVGRLRTGRRARRARGLRHAQGRPPSRPS